MKAARVLVFVLLVLLLTLNSGCEIITVTRTATPATTAGTTGTPIQPGFTIPILETTSNSLPSIADVVARVKPSVVAINVEVTKYDIFGRAYSSSGAGSGWIIGSDGIIVTNNHVVASASRVSVVLDDGRTFQADIGKIATDPLSDLAVIKIDARNLPAAKVGNSSSLRVGDWVVAIGNSLGQGIRATVGIVSQQSVSLEVSSGQTLTGLIETDAAINPGNSGGPLVNMAGEVVGINSVKIADVGVEGTGYSIGTSEAAPLLQQLVNNGYVTRPYLGVNMDSVNPIYVARYGLSVDKGALLFEVVPGSPAAIAGLQTGDVITKFADRTITSVKELREAIHQSRIGQTVEITYWRGKTQATTTATLLASSPR